MGKKQSSVWGGRGRRLMDEIRGLDPERVLVVPVDAAKFSCKAVICNYYGDTIVDPFSFSVDELGLAGLIMGIRTAEKRLKALRVFAAIEATGHYYEPVVRALEAHGYTVTIMNAYTTKEERNSELNWSKTDEIDLGLIGQALINNKGTEFRLSEGLLHEMLRVCRVRRDEIKRRSKTKIQIRGSVDRLWLGLQGYYPTGDGQDRRIQVFRDFWGRGCRWVLRNCPTPQEALELGAEGIRTRSKENGVIWHKETLKRLMQSAEGAIKRPLEETRAEREYLRLKLEELDSLEQTVEFLEQRLEGLLVQTPGVLLLSVKGLRVATAAEFFAEAEGVLSYRSAKTLIKKAGTNPLVSQSGDRQAHYGKISKQGNPALRYVLAVIGRSLSWNNPYFREFAERLKQKGLKPLQAHIAVGNKFIRVARAMIRDGVEFSPPTWQGPSLKRPILDQISDEEHRKTAAETLSKLKRARELKTNTA